MTQGYIPNQRVMQKANQRGLSDVIIDSLSSVGRGLSTGLDNIQNQAGLNRLNVLSSSRDPIQSFSEASDITTQIAQRVNNQANRQKESREQKLVDQGLANRLTDKPKLIGKIGKADAKDINSARLDLDTQGTEALNQFEKQLRDSGSLDENEIADAMDKASRIVQQKNQEIIKSEANKSLNFIDKQGGLTDLEKTSLKANEYTKAIGQTPSNEAQALPIKAKALGIANTAIGTGVQEVGGLLSLPKVINRNLPDFGGKALSNIGQELLDSEASQVLQNQNPLVRGTASLGGGSIPYLAAEALTGGAAGVALPMVQKIGNPLLRRVAGAAIENALEEAVVNPGRQLNTTGQVSGGQYLQDVLGSGVAGGLLGGGIEGINQLRNVKLPKVESPRGESGVSATLEKPITTKPSNDFNMSDTYRQVGQEMEKAGLTEQAIKFYKKADANDPLLVQDKLRKQKGVSEVKRRIAEEEATLQKSAQSAQSNQSDNYTPAQVDNSGNPIKLSGEASYPDKVPLSQLEPETIQPIQKQSQNRQQLKPEKPLSTYSELDPLPLQTSKQNSNLGQNTQTGKPIIAETKPSQISGLKTIPLTKEQKIGVNELKNQYSEVLNKETAISEKSVRDGLEELGFEVKTNAKGEKFAQLGNVKVSLKDMPPPYSLSGLKSSLKERIASAKAAKDIQAGKVSDIEGIRSEFLDDVQASKYLDQLDEKSLYEEKQFIDSIRRASKQELEQIYKENDSLFKYDTEGNPSKYLEEAIKREAQLDSPTSKQSLPVQTVDELAKTSTEPIQDYEKAMAEAMLKADPRSFRSGKPPDVKDWTEFQQKYRNPENYNTLDKQIDTKLKPRQKNIIEELAKTQQVRKNLDETVKKANRELTKQLKPGESITVKVGKNTYTFTRKDTELVLNAKGQKELQEALDNFNKGREPQFEQSKDSLRVQVANIQPEIPRISQRTKEGLANFIVEKSVKYANIDKEYQALKGEFETNFKPDELFGKVWTDKNNTATFHIAKGSLKDTQLNSFKAQITKDLKASKAFTEEVSLKYPETVKEGRLPPTSTKKAQEAIKQRLDLMEIKKEGIHTAADIETIAKSFEGVKTKTKKAKGANYVIALNAALKLAQGNPIDAILAGIRGFGGFNKLAEKTNNKAIYQAAEMADAFTGMQRGIETRLMDIDHPAANKFLNIYKTMTGQEFMLRGKMNKAVDSKLVSPDELETIKKFFDEKSPEELDLLFANKGVIEGITNPAAYAYAEAMNSLRGARKEVLDAITKTNILPPDARLAFETLLNLDNSVYGQVHSDFNQTIINEVLYSTALGYRITSLPTVLTDIPMKAGATQGIRNTLGAITEFITKNPKILNSELFQSFKAQRMGNSWSQELKALDPRSKNILAPLWNLAKKYDPFANTTSATQNIGLIAIAKRFEQKYNKANNTKIDIFKEYNGSNDISREFAIYANEQLNDLYNVGVGSLAKSGVSGNQLTKSLLFLKSENLRYQNLENKWIQQMSKGSEEVKREAAAQFAKYKIAQLLVGGTSAIGIGSVGNLLMSNMTAEQQDNFKETINYFNLGRLINIDLTDKLGTAILRRKPGQSIYEATESTIKDMDNPIVAALLNYPKALDNWSAAYKNGDIAGQIKAITAPLPFLSGMGDLMSKAYRQYKGEFQPFYIQTAPGKYEGNVKELEKGDFIGKTWTTHNAQEMADYERGAKELVKKIGVEKVGKVYKLKKDSPELNSYLNVLIKPKFYKNDPEMYRIGNLPDGTPAKEKVKNEIKKEILKSAYLSVQSKQRSIASKAPISNPSFWANAEKETIEKVYKVNPQKGKEMIQKVIVQKISDDRKKFLRKLQTVN